MATNNTCQKFMRETVKLLMLVPSEAPARAAKIYVDQYFKSLESIGQENMPPFLLTFQPSSETRPTSAEADVIPDSQEDDEDNGSTRGQLDPHGSTFIVHEDGADSAGEDISNKSATATPRSQTADDDEEEGPYCPSRRQTRRKVSSSRESGEDSERDCKNGELEEKSTLWHIVNVSMRAENGGKANKDTVDAKMKELRGVTSKNKACVRKAINAFDRREDLAWPTGKYKIWLTNLRNNNRTIETALKGLEDVVGANFWEKSSDSVVKRF